ncbi:phosphate ABC transporter, inner membrane subunit PstA [Spirochaeta thermophila DSM 6578]|uniref:Phosphate transport system permease protein PstA n=1 Tax=Winmispira thermophila (strain ATCC 700085 / DSM 6578 / Z-1203) TaxID=869211 RepID=G0G9T4_WINT7|nr:phosphate ABC transporter permease PstA [Spirochaeta thermophila]AEJ60834.1 phosphate ABC transporter, inner membrane subunit PstA [Spirochaeta thermophila DSM 6578]
MSETTGRAPHTPTLWHSVGAERIKDRIFLGVAFLATVWGLLSLAGLLVYVFSDAIGWLDWQFLTSPPSRFPEKAGVGPVLAGSFYLIVLVGLMVFPFGVGAAIYLEEYAKEGRLKRLIETNIANLAGVPSIVYGLLGLGVFVGVMHLPIGCLLVASLTLMLRVLPIVIVSAQEAIRAVPDSHRFASLGMGTTRWQMITSVVLPEAFPGIMTGIILALANAMGETAPLIMVGVAHSIFTPPRGLLSAFGALPLQIFAWSDYPKPEFQHGVVPAAIVVLLVTLMLLNGIAVYLRHRFSKRRW